MAHNLTLADVLEANVTVPDGGDPRTAASVELPFQQVANRTEYTIRRARGVIDQGVYVVPMAPFITSNFSAANGPFGFSQTNVSSAGNVIFALDTLPVSGAKINKLIAKFKPATGHAGVPGTQPIIGLYRQANDGSGSGELVDDEQLAAGSVVAYEAAQSLELVFGTPHAISLSHTYYAVFEGEAGANAETGLLLVRVELVMSP